MPKVATPTEASVSAAVLFENVWFKAGASTLGAERLD